MGLSSVDTESTFVYMYCMQKVERHLDILHEDHRMTDAGLPAGVGSDVGTSLQIRCPC